MTAPAASATISAIDIDMASTPRAGYSSRVHGGEYNYGGHRHVSARILARAHPINYDALGYVLSISLRWEDDRFIWSIIDSPWPLMVMQAFPRLEDRYPGWGSGIIILEGEWRAGRTEDKPGWLR